jgi:hypothetical protein
MAAEKINTPEKRSRRLTRQAVNEAHLIGYSILVKPVKDVRCLSKIVVAVDGGAFFGDRRLEAELQTYLESTTKAQELFAFVTVDFFEAGLK